MVRQASWGDGSVGIVYVIQAQGPEFLSFRAFVKDLEVGNYMLL